MNNTTLNDIFVEIDKMNSTDSRIRSKENIPEEVFYGQKMTEMLQKLYPNAIDELQIACRGQHIQRFSFPRTDFPTGRIGYLQWRKFLYKKHAKLLAKILHKFDLSQKFIDNVTSIVSKSSIKTNPNTQCLEDIACLVFLKYYFIEFAQKHPEEKVITILQKTWKKMSTIAQNFALTLSLSPQEKNYIKKALENS